MLLRVAGARQNEILSYYPCFQGDMAQMFAELEWESIAEMSLEDFATAIFPILEDMIKESDKRKLNYENIPNSQHARNRSRVGRV